MLPSVLTIRGNRKSLSLDKILKGFDDFLLSLLLLLLPLLPPLLLLLLLLPNVVGIIPLL